MIYVISMTQFRTLPYERAYYEFPAKYSCKILVTDSFLYKIHSTTYKPGIKFPQTAIIAVFYMRPQITASL